MSYLTNFADTTIVTSIRDGDLSNIESDIFRFEVPPSVVIDKLVGNNDIALDLNREFFELHLYERNAPIGRTPRIIKSVAVPFSEGYLYIREGAPQNILRLGLTFWPGDTETAELDDEDRAQTFIEKYLSDVPFGEYDCIVNFFSNELGTYGEDEWQVKQISDSRREVILERNPTTEKPFDYIEYQQFAYDSIFAPDFDIIVQRIFQSGETVNEFRRLILDFINRLVAKERSLFDSFDEQGMDKINNAFDIIFRELLQEILKYSEAEVNVRRYRIVEENFDYWLHNKIYEIVAKHIHLFPEGGNLFVVDIVPPEEDPDVPDGGDPEPPFIPPRSDEDDGQVTIINTDLVPERTGTTSTSTRNLNTLQT